MSSDTVVREAAQAALASDHVGPGGRRRQAGRHRRRRGDPARRRRRRGRRRRRRRARMSALEPTEADGSGLRHRALRRRSSATGLPGVLGRHRSPLWVVVWVVHQGQRHPRDLGGSTRTGVHNWLGDRATRPCWPSPRQPVHRRAQRDWPTASTASSRQLQELFSLPAVPAAGAADRLARRHRDRGLGHVRHWPAAAACRSSRSQLRGVRRPRLLAGQHRHLLIVTLVAVALVAIGIPLAIWMAHSKTGDAPSSRRCST